MYVCVYAVCMNIWIIPSLVPLDRRLSKVAQLHYMLRPHEEVFSFDVSMDEPVLMKVCLHIHTATVIDFSWDSRGRCALSTLVPKACTRDFKAHYVCIVYVSLPFRILPRLCCSPDTLSKTCRGSRRCGGWADGSSDCLPRNTPAPTTYKHTYISVYECY